MNITEITKGKKSFHHKMVNKHLLVIGQSVDEILNDCLKTKYDYGYDTFEYRRIKVMVLIQDKGDFDTNQIVIKMGEKGYDVRMSEKIPFGEEIIDYGLNDFAEEIGLDYDGYYSFSQELLLANIRVLELVWKF